MRVVRNNIILAIDLERDLLHLMPAIFTLVEHLCSNETVSEVVVHTSDIGPTGRCVVFRTSDRSHNSFNTAVPLSVLEANSPPQLAAEAKIHLRQFGAAQKAGGGGL